MSIMLKISKIALTIQIITVQFEKARLVSEPQTDDNKKKMASLMAQEAQLLKLLQAANEP